jgi:hypothetical protein
MKTTRLCSIVSILVLCLTATADQVQAQQPGSGSTNAIKPADRAETIDLSTLLARAGKSRRRAFSLMPERGNAGASGPAFSIAPMATGSGLPVMGGGTLGRLTKWTGFTSSNSAIGDSSIYEDKFGKVGIGTDAPTSALTVAGTIEATGGFKFPSGSHDATLKGDGTTASPLGVAVPLLLSGAVDGVIKANNTGPGAGAAVAGVSTNGFGVTGDSSSGIGVSGFSSNSIGVVGTSTNSYGVHASSLSTGVDIAGLKGTCDDCTGVFGTSIRGFGVRGEGVIGMVAVGMGSPGTGLQASGGSGPGGSGPGVVGGGGSANNGDGGDGLRGFGGTGSGAGRSGGSGIAGFAGLNQNGATIGLAGSFSGDVRITGKLTVTSGMKMFHIDHPLDPENKYLNHAAIESSEVLNVYSGNVTTDENGDAVVTLPSWFEALNSDFRYQLTVIGTFSQAIVAEKIKGNRFVIKTNAPVVEVSWQVTGVRSDATARKYHFEVEEEKGERERGYYANPDAYGQPEERGIEWARNPQLMQQMKQQRLEAGHMRLKQQPNQR